MKQKDLDALNDPRTYQPGPGRDKKNLDYWSKRASDNSGQATRATDGPMELPSTTVTVRDSSMKPKEPRKVNKAMRGEDPAEHNNVGSSFMPGVRRKV
jgi:hypothetical protein